MESSQQTKGKSPVELKSIHFGVGKCFFSYVTCTLRHSPMSRIIRKSVFLHVQKQRRRTAVELISTFVFTITLLPIFEISSLKLSSVAVQSGSWSQTKKTHVLAVKGSHILLKI